MVLQSADQPVVSPELDFSDFAGFSKDELAALEDRTQQLGRELLARAEQKPPHPLQRRWWDDHVMSWAMQDEQVKVELFRFVDVLPMLARDAAVSEHLYDYLGPVRDRLPTPVRVALGLTQRVPFTQAAVARAARLTTMDLARRFIAGTNTREVLAAARRERERGRSFTLDILGEAVTSEMEAQRYFQAYVELIQGIAPTVNQWPELPRIDRSVWGPLPRMNLSIKLSALDSQFDAIDPQGSLYRAGRRFAELLRVARHERAFINVDMESYDKKDLTLWIFQQVLMEPEFRDLADVGIVIQSYLKDSAADLQALRDWAAQRGTPLWVRLVKGAYWDYELVHARANGWPVPVFQQKWQSDASFERLTRFLLKNHQLLRPAIGSHNTRSMAHALAVAGYLGLPQHSLEPQMLYGMADAEKQALVDLGYRLRVYMPYGELIPGMAYLVRRLLENTSDDSFLRAGFVERVPPEQLLRPPLEVGGQQVPRAGRQAGPAPSRISGDGAPQHGPPDRPGQAGSLQATFCNEPPVDFSVQANRQSMCGALEQVRGKLGRHYRLVIGGRRVDTRERVESPDPCQKDRIVGTTAAAGPDQVQAAVEAARAALPAWWALGAERRAQYLRKAADTLRRRMFELAAWEVYECAKPWREATNDICEAIDFCEYYAAGAIELERPRGADVPGEENRFEYLPRGVAAVIAPWNFPLAILTGMTTAALATGNTVVMKPAEQSPVLGALLMEIFQDLDLPPGVLNYLSGWGETAGAPLVEHPDVALIAFTGSRQVGLGIHGRAAELSGRKNRFIKRVIAEMGGKNAAIVDSDADLDEAVLGVAYSAFGYQGQKCSACSRAIVLESVYDVFLGRLIEAARSLPVGPAEDPATVVGAVIDQDAQSRVHKYIELGRQEAREVLSVDVGPLAERGFFVGPHVFADVPPQARIAQEEIFGPVLAVIRATDLDHAIEILNDTDYGLTGGIFSRSPAHLQRARRELMVGNLYLNRGITGSLVNRQPFGGLKLSGIGSKAGGPDYLLQFVVPRAITENTMRRGFAPMPEK